MTWLTALTGLGGLIAKLQGLLRAVGAFLSGFLYGRSREKQKTNSAVLDAVRRADNVRVEVSRLSDGDVLQQLRKYWTRK